MKVRDDLRAGRHQRLNYSILALILCWSTFPGMSEAKIQNELKDRDRVIYDSLATASIDTASCFEVIPGSRWATDLGEYEFQSGALYFLAPVAGTPSGCWFRGKGRLHYAPPYALERGQLKRFYGDSVLDATFKEVYFRFFDSAVASGLLHCAAREKRAEIPGDGALKRFAKDAAHDIRLDLAARGWELVSDRGRRPAFLYARPDLSGQRPLHFLLDDTERESVQLLRKPPGVSSSGIVDVVCSYDRNHATDQAAWRATVLDGGIDIRHYESLIKIDGSGAMALDVQLTCVMLRDQQVVLPFMIAPELKFDSIISDGRNIPFVYDDESGSLLAGNPRPVNRGDTLHIRFRYHGKRLLDKFPWGDFFIHYTTRWLPTTGERHHATYQTTFEIPKYYDVVSVGERIFDSADGDHRLSTWRTFGAVSFISFNYGSFERLTDTMAGGPRIEIYRGTNHLNGLFGKDFKKRVAAEIETSVQLFSSIFGPYPWPHLAVTEIPGEHGQGFPQLLHLAWYSFDQEEKGVTDVFRAHEVAHQWFGHIVGWKTYHDQWLSEGFAEYAGALYLQARHKGSDEFFNFMKRLREQILKQSVFGGWHEGPQVAPIWLGYRCSSFDSPASYQNLIYAKGAYVLHMLRIQMYDYQKDSDARFTAMMHDYITSFGGLDATTDEFRTIVERHLNMPMDWFFNQWVMGTQIPRFEYRWNRRQQADGRWTVRGTIDQFDTDPPFRVFMPITLVFAEGRRTFVQEITARHTEFETPATVERPKDVLFNDFFPILCREKTVEKP